eukprot:GHUV01057636.1.p1 GENE.GHUV01057636.1~~GHUV01057636.1.p1  ORF type:complete len:194 (+),score=33.50 GHUV01057636.1:45-626(+)
MYPNTADQAFTNTMLGRVTHLMTGIQQSHYCAGSSVAVCVSAAAALYPCTKALCCARARLSNGQSILELGCGWGSLSLFMAQAYPSSSITAVSNSSTQKEFIMKRARDLDIHNLQVITADMVDFQAPDTYDRVVSVEMFEHMKNYQELMRRISTWIKPGGGLFVHIFAHKSSPYHFEVRLLSVWTLNNTLYII